MAAELQHSIASRAVCPQCLALNSATADRCANCDFKLGWTRQATFRHFGQALSVQRTAQASSHWDFQLRAELVWPTGNCRFEAAFVADLHWDLPFGQRLSLRLLDGEDRLEVVRGNMTIRASFPCRDVELDLELRLHAGLFARPSDVDQPGELGSDGTASFFRPLDGAREFTVGRVGCSLSVPDPAFREHGPHFVIAVEPSTNGNAPRLWLANIDPQSNTFVNQQRVWAIRLQTNDVIQVGPFGWAVWVSDSDFGLIPIAQIDGVGLMLEDIRARNLQPIRLEIEPGEFVALCGPSGAGKSTLLKAIADVPHVRTGGRLRIRESSGDAWNASAEPDRFRKLLGYVSQESVLHDSLTPRQALRYASALRGQALDDPHIDWLLLRAEIPPQARSNPIRNLSGGENKRLRTAAELAASPRLLLLDEPDSGLDAERRRRLLKHLKTLSRQGCTVIMISHGSDDLLADGFDRVLRIENQKIASNDRSPMQRRRIHEISPSNGFKPITHSPSRSPIRDTHAQLSPLVLREFASWLSDPVDWGRLSRFGNVVLPRFPGRLVAMFLVAFVFAVALAVAVPSHNRHLLGFLSVISVLWMSSSLSLMSIAGERAVFDHERHLLLRLGPYVLSKLLVLLALAGIQTALFLAVLTCLRSSFAGDSAAPIFAPEQTVASWLTLFLVAAIGVALGLGVSAFANRRKEVATFVLPLLMIGQIVFSAPIAEGRPNDSLDVAYRNFHWPLPAVVRNQNSNTQLDASSTEPKPLHRCAALCSYFTVSRYGDIALRGINEDGTRTSHELAIARTAVHRARLMLALLFVGFTAATIVLLARQSRAAQRHTEPPSEK